MNLIHVGLEMLRTLGSILCMSNYGKPSLCMLHLQAAVHALVWVGAQQCKLDDEGAIRAFTMGRHS